MKGLVLQDLTPKHEPKYKKKRGVEHDYEGERVTVIEVCKLLNIDEKGEKSIRNFMTRHKISLIDAITMYRSRGQVGKHRKKTPWGKGL